MDHGSKQDPDAKKKKKLVLSKETLKNLSVRTGVNAGYVPIIVFPPDPSHTCTCGSCGCSD